MSLSAISLYTSPPGAVYSSEFDPGSRGSSPCSTAPPAASHRPFAVAGGLSCLFSSPAAAAALPRAPAHDELWHDGSDDLSFGGGGGYSHSPLPLLKWRDLHHPRNRYLLHLDAGAGAYERARLAGYVRSEPAFLEYGNVHVVVTQDDLLHALSAVPRDLNFIDHRTDSETAPVVVLDQKQSTNAEISFSSWQRAKPDAFELFKGSPWTVLSRGFVEHCVVARGRAGGALAVPAPCSPEAEPGSPVAAPPGSPEAAPLPWPRRPCPAAPAPCSPEATGTPLDTPSSTDAQPACVTNAPTDACRSTPTCGAHGTTSPAARSRNPGGSNGHDSSRIDHRNGAPLASSPAASSRSSSGRGEATVPKLTYATDRAGWQVVGAEGEAVGELGGECGDEVGWVEAWEGVEGDGGGVFGDGRVAAADSDFWPHKWLILCRGKRVFAYAENELKCQQRKEKLLRVIQGRKYLVVSNKERFFKPVSQKEFSICFPS